MGCGGKQSATPLFGRTKAFVYSNGFVLAKAPPPLRSASAVQNLRAKRLGCAFHCYRFRMGRGIQRKGAKKPRRKAGAKNLNQTFGKLTRTKLCGQAPNMHLINSFASLHLCAFALKVCDLAPAYSSGNDTPDQSGDWQGHLSCRLVSPKSAKRLRQRPGSCSSLSRKFSIAWLT